MGTSFFAGLSNGSTIRNVGRAIKSKYSRIGPVRSVCKVVTTASLPCVATLAGIYMPALVDDGRSLWHILQHRESHLRDVRTLEDIASAIDPVTDHTYLFVLDCSWSTDDQMVDIPGWYESVVSDLRSRGYPLDKDRDKSGYDVARIGIYSLIDKLAQESDDRRKTGEGLDLTENFAVWDVCGEGRKLYPEDPPAVKANKASAVGAVRAIETRTLGKEPETTSFLEFFRGIDRTYEISRGPRQRVDREHAFVVNVISDFLDDPGYSDPEQSTLSSASEERAIDGRIERRYRELEKAIEEVFLGNVTVNALRIGASVGGEPDIVRFMRANADWYRFNEFSVEGLVEYADSLLLPVYKVRQPLRIYYLRGSDVHGGITLRTVKHEERLSFALSTLDMRQPAERFGLEYGCIGGEDTSKAEVTGFLASGRVARFDEMPANNSIFFEYRGSVPLARQVLKVSVGSHRRSYLIPLRFTLRVPPMVAEVLFWMVVSLVLSLGTPPGIAGVWGFWHAVMYPRCDRDEN